MSKCGLETETTLHFLLRYVYSSIRAELLNDMPTDASSVSNYLDEKLLKIILYKSEDFSVKMNQSIYSLQSNF